MTRLLIGLAGRKESGKDTVADYLVQCHKFEKYAFADPIRKAALAVDPIVALPCAVGVPYARLSAIVEAMGWDEARRHPEVRRLLQRFGSEMGRRMFGDNVWIDILFRRVEKDLASRSHNIVVSDCRLPSEMDALRRRGGSIIHIVRPNIETDQARETEMSLDDYPHYAARITNDDTIPTLYSAVDQVLDAIIEPTI